MAIGYVTWAQVASAVGGEKRLKEDVLVGHAGETAEVHPFFTDQLEIVERLADAHLARGGYAIPAAAPVADALLRNAIIGALVGKLTEASSNREPWMEKMEQAALATLKDIGDGTITLVGVELADEIEDANPGISGSLVDGPMFDTADPYAQVNQVFGNISIPGWTGWRRS